MHRIDADANVANQFSEGNPGLGQPGTVVSADWLNAVQEEVCNAITSAGIALSKPVNTQLQAALAWAGSRLLALANTWAAKQTFGAGADVTGGNVALTAATPQGVYKTGSGYLDVGTGAGNASALRLVSNGVLQATAGAGTTTDVATKEHVAASLIRGLAIWDGSCERASPGVGVSWMGPGHYHVTHASLGALTAVAVVSAVSSQRRASVIGYGPGYVDVMVFEANSLSTLADGSFTFHVTP